MAQLLPAAGSVASFASGRRGTQNHRGARWTQETGRRHGAPATGSLGRKTGTRGGGTGRAGLAGRPAHAPGKGAQARGPRPHHAASANRTPGPCVPNTCRLGKVSE